MNISINTNEGELFYEIGDWANVLPLKQLVHNFEDLSKAGKDIIIAAVIAYTMVNLSNCNDDEEAVNGIRDRFNDLTD